MSSSIRGGSAAPPRAAGKNIDALGPSDSSDSGSDVRGESAMPTAPDNPAEWGALPVDLDSDSDASGTGERGSATGKAVPDGADILPDQAGAAEMVDEDADTDDAGAADELDVDSDTGASTEGEPPPTPTPPVAPERAKTRR
jgi:hypothetical protein